MDGFTELLQLAHLLRTGASVARDIAALRPKNAIEIDELADQAEEIAERLTRIAQGTQPA